MNAIAATPRTRRITALWCALLLGAAACTTGSESSAEPDAEQPDQVAASTDDVAGLVEREVEIASSYGITSGTFVSVGDGPSPAVVLIAGSGPTDRDGNTALAPGAVDTLRFLADELADAGIASVRYDKLGVGGSDRPANLAALTFTDFVEQADEVRAWVATQPGSDPERITIAGHSEGGLIALELATAVSPDAVALIAPPGGRYLDLIRSQVLDAGIGVSADDIDAPIAELRQTGVLADRPDNEQLAALFNPTVHAFLADADTRDPVELIAGVDASTRVLLVCAESDIQVSCDSLDGLRAAAPDGLVDTRLVGVNHVLRPSGPVGDASTYTDTSLGHSAEASTALIDLVNS